MGENMVEAFVAFVRFEEKLLLLRRNKSDGDFPALWDGVWGIADTQGEVLARVGRDSYGEQKGRFFSPHGIAVDSKGDIYVAEVAYSDYGSKMDPPRELRSMQKLVKI